MRRRGVSQQVASLPPVLPPGTCPGHQARAWQGAGQPVAGELSLAKGMNALLLKWEGGRVIATASLHHLWGDSGA